jgi:hypothetical protein
MKISALNNNSLENKTKIVCRTSAMQKLLALLGDGPESFGIEARASNQNAVDIVLAQEFLGIRGRDRPTVQNADGLADFP